jgi:hypothetical protein
LFGKKERNALPRDRARLTKLIQSISYFTGAEIIFSYNKMQNLMVTVIVKVTLTFRVTIKLKVKITVEVTDFYGKGELRLFAATNTRNPHYQNEFILE